MAFVGQATATSTGSSQAVAYTATVGNLVLLFIAIEGNGVTTSVLDSAGLDLFNNPLNAWNMLANVVTDTGMRMEVWCCGRVAVAFTSVTVQFSVANSSSHFSLLEYSNAAVGGVGGVKNSGFSNIFFVGTAENNSSLLVTAFANPIQDPAVGSGVYAPNGKPLQTITPGVSRSFIAGDPYMRVQEQTVITGAELVLEAWTTAPTSFGALGVVLSGGLTLSIPPGFSPVDETKLLAGTTAHAIVLDQIALNGAFGMVRPEFFYTIQVDGDTVPLPISPIDSYNYVADELYYIYTPLTTFDPNTGWVGASGLLFYCQWDIDQTTGKVICQEFYHPDGNKPVNKTSDGQLLVLTVGQRARGSLSMPVPPSLSQLPFARFATDKALQQTDIQTLAKNSKFAAVKAEVIYMGEFVNGNIVPQPISPEDGYVYSYAEVKFISSWKWTTNPANFNPPPMATASGGNADGGWSQLNELQSSVSSSGLVNCQVFFQNHGVIDPSTAPNGSTAFGRLKVFAFCQRASVSFGVPLLTNGNGAQASANTTVVKIAAPKGTITGKLSAVFAAGTSGGALVVTKACIKKTLAGSLTVLTTDNLLFGGSAGATIAQSTQKQTDLLTYTMDTAHDYYLMVVYTGSFSYQLFQGSVNTNTPPISYNSGDLSAVTTIPALTFSGSVWDTVAAILFNIVDPTLANSFVEVPLNNFMPGQPLLASSVNQIAKNVQEGCYAVEFFGPTNHVNGDTIALPTSPQDGYTYNRDELFYIWNWHDTGTADIRVFAFGASISAAGVIATFVWHCGTGGPPHCWPSGPWGGSKPADGSIDVMVIACRARHNPQGGSNSVVVNNPPTDSELLGYGGSGGYTINGAP